MIKCILNEKLTY